MTGTKDDLSARREWALEAAARDLGISTGELKRRLSVERQIKAARARGDDWMVPMLQACDTSFIQDVVRDQQNAPRGQSQAGASGQVIKVSSNAGLPGSNTTGWRDARPLGPQPGINHVDRQLDEQDRRDRAELVQRAEAMGRAELAQKGKR